MERKDVYFPRLIWQCMWRAHIRGLLPFPTLVTSMAALAEPPARRRSRARAVVGTAGQSAPTSAPSSSAAPEPTYLLVQRLFRFLERERLHVRRRLDRMDQALISLGAELPPLPDSPASDEQDHQEEDAEAPTQQDAPATIEPTQTHAEPVPQPQPDSAPTVVPSTDPPA
ncbi:hypothetical protein Ahy_A06g030062 isoform A [Arachis hypogaea]|uniref:Uncharacterized protein n=1 Tax=Arachis hypogaea TaxID=3818 RepID=A0A445CV36_ARAHY|nr:hypothetical protein Ahy_A06g030062 isoform A [Arachis hypogaea]